ncbi:hypothetical protein CR513_05513, partial [Mucuna pruriens]
MNSMTSNQVWNLVELPNGVKAIQPLDVNGFLKIKKDSQGNIKKHKTRIFVKGFTQGKGIDYTETFSLVSKKDSLRVIMVLVALLTLSYIKWSASLINQPMDQNKLLASGVRFVFLCCIWMIFCLRLTIRVYDMRYGGDILCHYIKIIVKDFEAFSVCLKRPILTKS